MDKSLIVSHPDAIQDTIEHLRKIGFIVKVEDDLRDFLSCEIRFNSGKRNALLGQPHLLANLERKFGKDGHCMRGAKTPGTPSFGLLSKKNHLGNKNCIVQVLDCWLT